MKADGRSWLDQLLDPRFVGALFVLIANDHVAKAAFGTHPVLGTITGKLSDFAGMVVLPVLLMAALALLRRSWLPDNRLLSDRALRITALASSGLLLFAIKVSPRAASAVERVLAGLTDKPQTITVDPTDLLGLLALVVAHRVMIAPRPVVLSRFARPIGRFAFGLGVLACVATSYDEDAGWTRVEVDQDGVVQATSQDRGSITSTDEGRTWDGGTRYGGQGESSEAWRELPNRDRGPTCLKRSPQTCIRLRSENRSETSTESRIEESNDGGQTWAAAWTVSDTEAIWITEKFGYNARISFADLVVLDDDTVVVAAAHLEPIRRDPLTGEWSPSMAEVQQVPVEFLLAAIVTALPLLGAVRRFRAGSLEGLVWVGAAVAIGVGALVAASDSIGPGVVFGSGIVAAVYVVLLILMAKTAQAPHVKWNRPLAAAGFGGTVVVVAVPFLLFAAAAMSWPVAYLSTLVLIAAAPVVFGFVGPPTWIAPPHEARIPPPPRAIAGGGGYAGVMPPPPTSPTMSVVSAAPDFPYLLIGLTPLVAGPAAAIASLAFGFVRSLIPRTEFLDAVLAVVFGGWAALVLYGVAGGLWVNAVVKRSGWVVPYQLVRALLGVFLSVAIGFGAGVVVGDVFGVFGLAIGIPIAAMRFGAQSPEPTLAATAPRPVPIPVSPGLSGERVPTSPPVAPPWPTQEGDGPPSAS